VSDYVKMTEPQKARARDISENETTQFMRLCKSIGEYNEQRHMYVMSGDEEAYTQMRTAKSKIRAEVLRLWERWSTK